MKGLCSGALLALLLAGCATPPSPLQRERGYVLEWIGERPLMDYSHLSLTLGSDGRAYGNAGCNHWFASYTLSGQQLSFGKVGKTRKLCAPALMEQEQRFLAELEKVQRWDASAQGQIRFWPASGQALRFWPEDD
ncbi:META domain-containing protein [Pseudomonas cremoricolorata]|uniref:Lipoprotein n=1 Tax=Pseudomonas cremoricolorata TaxID=157783 RepID=A0A089WRV7_9PSED|nr:META domain-containing protein [Pseudomonas cremoricolorata]AIR89914.1 lipoprotein [Pseudomonas cremoricolorata]